MAARDPEEKHRVATPLELLFDLCFVVAVSGAAHFLEHHIAQGDWRHGVIGYLQVFFAVWWGWMNFSWFASAFDVDDMLYRVMTMVQIAGALIVAAGAFEPERMGADVIIAGYAVMRLALIAQWARAAVDEPAHRPTAIRYAVGIGAVQVLWIVMSLTLGSPIFSWYFWVGAACELLVPTWAERRSPTPWHPHHISERYGLFTIIVLGEAVAGSATAIREGMAEEHVLVNALVLAGSAIVILFAMWWIYFERPVHHRLTNPTAALTWGFGHYWIYASGAAVGAAFGVLSEHLSHREHNVLNGLALAVPVAVYVVGVWLLQFERSTVPAFVSASFPTAAALILASAFTPWPEIITAVLMAALVLLLNTTCEPQDGHDGFVSN